MDELRSGAEEGGSGSSKSSGSRRSSSGVVTWILLRLEALTSYGTFTRKKRRATLSQILAVEKCACFTSSLLTKQKIGRPKIANGVLLVLGLYEFVIAEKKIVNARSGKKQGEI